MEAVAEHGTKWSHIVKLVPGRTDNAIKNRWNSTTRKLLRQQRRYGGEVGLPLSMDITKMGAAELARYLLDAGLSHNDMVPRVKRKLSSELTSPPTSSETSQKR